MTSSDNSSDNSNVIPLPVNLLAMQGRFNAAIQKLLDAYAAAASALPSVDDATYSSFVPSFLSVQAHNTRLTRDEAVAEAKQWLLCTLIRDAIELTNLFLDQCRYVSALFGSTHDGKLRGEDYNRIIDKEQNKFHRLGLPEKLEKMREAFGISVELKPHVLSINYARRCLVHRMGVVSKLDVDGNNELPILWRTVEILASSPDKSEHFVIDSPGMEVQGGWNISSQITDKRKIFKLGERLQFSYREIADTIFTLMEFSSTMVQKVEQYGRSVGIVMSPPSDSSAKKPC
ncbi:MAG: hypothetical protein ABSH16_03315 [Sedimentisphaerales bacterium]